jgi:hypothetical protein
MTQISYGKVKTTRHTIKHCTGKPKTNRGRVIIAGAAALGSKKTRKQYIVDEALTLAQIQREMLYGEFEYKLDKKGKLHKKMILEQGSVRQEECEVWHDNVKMFKPLTEKSVSCSARGGNNGGTKDKRVSTVVNSPDVDFVSERTGIVPLARNGRHMTKVSCTTLTKERAKFRAQMLHHKVMMGAACYINQDARVSNHRDMKA